MLQRSNNLINIWLYPFAFLYGIGVGTRNLLFDCNILPSENFQVPVICIGNLAVGGTGKTPHTEYLIKLLKDNYKIAVLSRGYKRKSSGFVLATGSSTSRDIGDEPFQIKSKFPEIEVAVDADRRRGITKLLELPLPKKPDVILLDDAFQHRYVKPMMSIVLTDSNRLFYNDALLPAGRLRESSKEIDRADIVIVTKCEKNLKPIDFRIMEDKMQLNANQSSFFTSIEYDDLKPVFKEAGKISKTDIGKERGILLISGIAYPQPFIKEVKRISENVKTAIYPDHYRFEKDDIKKLDNTFNEIEDKNKIILVTEKDAARLKDLKDLPTQWRKRLYYLPIKIKFIGNSRFDVEVKKRIKDFINKNKR